jgi:hypothetical protein
VKSRVNCLEDSHLHPNNAAIPCESSKDAGTSAISISDTYKADYKYLSLKQYVIELYANNPEILKAWKSSANIVKRSLAQITHEIITDKLLMEEQ